MAELRSAIFWVLNCPIYLLRCYITQKCQKVEADNSTEFTLLNKTKNVDEGEAALIAATADKDVFWLTTGDKKCLEALATDPNLESVCKRLRGRVICLEQIWRLRRM